MLAEKIVEHVDRLYQSFTKTNALYLAAESGAVTASMVMRYIVGVEHSIISSVPHLRLAINECRLRGFDDLALFYTDKIAEEIGHELWAVEDEQFLNETFRVPIDSSPPLAITRLADLQRTAIKQDPHLFLAYLLFSEYFTVIAVPGWVNLLQKRCQIPPESMSVLVKHAELDKDHVTEGITAINRLTAKCQDYEPFFDHLTKTWFLYEQFTNEVGAQRCDKAS